jgi:hypothetical protein
MPSWLSFCSSNLLLSPLWVFSNPVKILQWTLPSNGRTQRVLFSSVPICTLPRCPPGGVSSLPQNTQQFCLLLCTLAPAQCPPGRALTESSVILVFSTAEFSSNSQCPEFFFLSSPSTAPLCICSMPTWQSSTELTTKFCLQLCFSYTALPPEVFSNLKGLPPELLTSVLCLSTSLSDSAEFRSASSVHWYSETATLCHALLT